MEWLEAPSTYGYLDFLQLMSNAKLVLTDSGGIGGGDNNPWYPMVIGSGLRYCDLSKEGPLKVLSLVI